MNEDIHFRIIGVPYIRKVIMKPPHKSNGGECNRLITNKKQNI